MRALWERISLLGVLSVKVFRVFSGGAGLSSGRFGVCAASVFWSSPCVLPLWGCACPPGGCLARPVGRWAGRSRRPLHCDSHRGEFAAPWPRFSTSHDALRFLCSYGFGLKRSILWVKMVDFPLCRCHHCMMVIA